MTGADPAIEAADHVLDGLGESLRLRRLRDGLGDLATAAASQALRPVQAWLEDNRRAVTPDFDELDRLVNHSDTRHT